MRKQLNSALFFLIAAVLAILAPASVLAASPDSVAGTQPLPDAAAAAAYKASHDTDPHSPLSPSDLALLAQKDELARSYAREKGSHKASGQVSTEAASFSSNYLGSTQQGQINGYYCGPAAVSEALALKGVSLSQSSAASLLKTTTDGTAWSGVYANVPNPTDRPVPSVAS